MTLFRIGYQVTWKNDPQVQDWSPVRFMTVANPHNDGAAAVDRCYEKVFSDEPDYAGFRLWSVAPLRQVVV